MPGIQGTYSARILSHTIPSFYQAQPFIQRKQHVCDGSCAISSSQIYQFSDRFMYRFKGDSGSIHIAESSLNRHIVLTVKIWRAIYWMIHPPSHLSQLIRIVMFLARPQAVTQAKPGQNRPGRAKATACDGFWPGPSFEKPKPSHQGRGFACFMSSQTSNQMWHILIGLRIDLSFDMTSFESFQCASVLGPSSSSS